MSDYFVNTFHIFLNFILLNFVFLRKRNKKDDWEAHKLYIVLTSMCQALLNTLHTVLLQLWTAWRGYVSCVSGSSSCSLTFLWPRVSSNGISHILSHSFSFPLTNISKATFLVDSSSSSEPSVTVVCIPVSNTALNAFSYGVACCLPLLFVFYPAASEKTTPKWFAWYCITSAACIRRLFLITL